MTMTIRRVGAALGAEVTGIDLGAPIDNASFDRIMNAFIQHSVLVFRDQHLTPQQQVAFSRRFGPVERHMLNDALLADCPEVYVLSNKTEGGRALGRANAGQFWHSDTSYQTQPALGSLLYGLEVPDVGGDTMFCSTAAAYDALSPRMQQMLEGLTAMHHFRHAYETFIKPRPGTARVSEAQLDSRPPVEQPVIHVHPVSGRKTIYVNEGHTTHIVQLNRDESDALLQFLFRHSVKPEFVYRHQWRRYDLVMWDNRSSMHCAVRDYDATQPRHMLRTTITGEAAW